MYSRFNDIENDGRNSFNDERFDVNNTENMGVDLILHSLNAIRSMEIIDIATGCKMGFVHDLVIDIEESKIISIIMPGEGKNWFNKEANIEIPWNKVIRAGMDVILIDTSK